jgi:hypothetical protein
MLLRITLGSPVATPLSLSLDLLVLTLASSSTSTAFSWARINNSFSKYLEVRMAILI